jgi:hypothetical protein
MEIELIIRRSSPSPSRISAYVDVAELIPEMATNQKELQRVYSIVERDKSNL